ncbi:nucleopolyhedrovirus P10 family protein [Streptomyces sp. NPDC046977]|uniref:nucleopolyhedrovirus P10 family protein n=1 Tax=Streptomyces sp. NPDC046977 TaxID=3154703 RepID=UPI0034054538
MTADRLARAVRRQLGLGRVLPLGDAGDTLWVTESAATAVLRPAAARVPGVRLGRLRIGAAGPEQAAAPAPESAPPGALARLPLRIEAAFEATPDVPLPYSARRLRDALWEAAEHGVGLEPAAVDLTVTGLLDTDRPQPAGQDAASGAVPLAGPDDTTADDAAPGDITARAAAAAVPGVARLTARLGGHDHPARVQIAVGAGHRARDVARAVAAAVTAVTGDVTTVVVTDIAPGGGVPGARR